VDIVSVAQIGLPSQFSSATPALQAGQVIDALVLALLDNDLVRLALPGLVLDVRSQVALTPGTTVRLAVQSTPSGVQLVIVPDSHEGASNPVQSPRPPSAGQAPVAAGNQGNATTATTSSQATIVAIAGTRVESSPVPAPGPPDVTTAQVLGQATRIAASRQGGLAPLLANALVLVNSTPAATPKPVVQAAINLLGLALPLDEGLSGADVKAAFQQSGIFLEMHLAPADNAAPAVIAGTKPGAPAPSNLPGAGTSAPANDLKAALLVFRQVVKLWLDAAAPPDSPAMSGTAAAGPKMPAVADPAPQRAGQPEPPGSESAAAASPRAAPAPPPPYRGAPPVAQPAVAASIPASAEPAKVAQRLLAQTDAALARHTLLQVASIPGETHAAGQRSESQGPQWLFEVPFATRQGMSVAQFEISRDGRGNGSDARTIWRARFSLDVEPMGPVHAQVAVLGERAAVTLWAERPGTAAQLREHTAALSEALREAELEPGDIQCRIGAPAAPRPAGAGRFLDQAS
jgi:hypothetical protein